MDELLPFEIYTTPIASSKHDIYLGDEVVSDGLEYASVLHKLDTATGKDEIVLHLANFGGAVHAGIRLAHAVRNSKARVDVQVSAPCYSMGAILALAGDSLEMFPGTFLMFHNYSSRTGGKGGELAMSVAAFSQHVAHCYDYFCSPFVTTKEKVQIAGDKDLYVHTTDKDFGARIKRHFKGGK